MHICMRGRGRRCAGCAEKTDGPISITASFTRDARGGGVCVNCVTSMALSRAMWVFVRVFALFGNIVSSLKCAGIVVCQTNNAKVKKSVRFNSYTSIDLFMDFQPNYPARSIG